MQKRHELSTTHERMRLDGFQHILNFIKDGTVPNLVLTDEKKFDVQQCLNHQMIKFGVEMDQWKAGE